MNEIKLDIPDIEDIDLAFDEFLIEHSNLGCLELMHKWYKQLKINQKLREKIEKLEKDLEYSRAIEDPTLAANRKFRETLDILKPQNMCPFIARMERREGIDLDELEIVEG